MAADTVLIVTASYDIAADYVINRLRRSGTPVFRFNTDQFPSQIQAFFRPPDDIAFTTEDGSISSSRIKSVWYRRHVSPELPMELEPGARDFCERETRAFLNGVFSSLKVVHWMSSPQAITRAEQKPFQLLIASNLGFTIPDTMMTNDASRAGQIIRLHRMVAKAISSGYIACPEGNRAIFTNLIGPRDMDDLSGLTLAPVTFQEFIDKVSDIRVTVVGEEVFGAEILSQDRESSRIDWRATDDPHLVHRVHELPSKISNLCVKLVSNLGLNFAAIDLVLKADGSYVFLEINPNGEWVWLEDQLMLPISHRIAQWLDKI